MKTLKIIVCLSIVVAAIVYAAKTPTDFSADVAGFLKTKATVAVTETNGWLIFKGMDAKSQLQLTKADNNANILLDNGKMVKQKGGKVTGALGSILVGTSASDMATPTDVVYAGNDKFSIKLKGISVGTVIASSMKMVFVNGLNGTLAGGNAKGLKVMTELDLAGADAANRAVVGLATVPTVIKMVKSKKGKIEWVDATAATPVKAGKTKWKAKVAPSGDVQVADLAAWAEAKKNKNVTLVGPATNVVSGL